MSFRYVQTASLAAGLLFAASVAVFAQPTPGQATQAAAVKPLPFVSPVFADNMVLQRGKPDTIWGWSDPGDNVRVQIGANTATGTAGADRRWVVRIQPPATGGPYTVTITGHQSVELHNVLVGDVWLCGGQSNMGLPLRFTKNADDEIKAANYPDIRFFTVDGHPAYHHVDVIEGNWRVVSPETRKLDLRGRLLFRSQNPDRRSMSPSASSSMPLAEPPRNRGPAKPRSVHSTTSISRLPNSTG